MIALSTCTGVTARRVAIAPARPSPDPNFLHDKTVRRRQHGRQCSAIAALGKPELSASVRDPGKTLANAEDITETRFVVFGLTGCRVAVRRRGMTGRTAMNFMQNRPHQTRPGNGPADERSIVPRVSPLPVGNLTDLSIRPKFSPLEPYSGRMGSLPIQTV